MAATLRGERTSQRLLSTSIELVRTAGPTALTIRGVTRAAGISSAALYRHYDNLEVLQVGVRDHARERLRAAVERRWNAVDVRDNPSTVAHLHFVAVGRGYLDFSHTETGLFQSLFTPLSAEHGTLDQLRDSKAYALLCRATNDLVVHGLLQPGSRPGAELIAWSAVHGLANLLPRDAGLTSADYANAATAMMRTITAGLYDGPARPF